MAEVTLSVRVTPKELPDTASMGDALEWAMALGYRGKVEVFTDAAGNVVRGIELNHNTNGQQCIAVRGDVLIWDGKGITALTADEYSERTQ